MSATATLGHDVRNNFVGSNPRNSMSIQNSKGLLNMPGQNNCFLNSAVQVLWHLDIFRRSFRDISGHACMAESCIFCALKELFAQFQYSQESALPPDALRRALAETFFNQQRFQLGHMDDAAECFENILTRIHFHIANNESEDMCNAIHCIPHQKFAMNLVEQSICHSCGATSEPLSFTQMVHYVSASALCAQSKIMEREGKTDVNMFGHLLRKAGGMGDFRDCPSSCGAKIQICRTLMNRPDIVSVGVVWDSDHPPLDHILDVFRAIGTSMQLQNVFHSVVDKRWGTSTSHQLVGVVTYYGKHYSTFFFHTKLKVWIYFDDATVREIGPHWEQVIEKCCRGHFQPLLLLYASPNGSPISMEEAPQAITMVPAQKKIPMKSLSSQDVGSKNRVVENKPRRSSTPSADIEYHKHYIDEAVKSHKRVARQLSVDDLLSNSRSNQDNFAPYISRKAVENILTQQKVNWQQHSPNAKLSYNSTIAGNRNSNSSLESFENALKMRMNGNDLRLELGDNMNSPRRRDSGNWSGDRNSASSSSSTSQENPYFFLVGKSKNLLKSTPTSPKRTGPDQHNMLSDAGYDSFSLSSTDSFPSINLQGKYDIKLCQIPENPMSLVSTDHFPPQGFVDDCDRLCFEADQLLLLSQEKENEGDLTMALTLSDCAASKARAAMDAPYNNSKSIMAAKMKHSTCVMRSCSLHRRLAQELKEAKSSEGRHSRQSSRDSTKSNKSSKEKSQKDSLEKQNKNSIDIYGTLPKKHSRRRCNSSGSSSEMKAAAIRASHDMVDSVGPTQEIYVKSEGKRTVRDVKLENKHKKLNREDGLKYKEHKKELLDGYLSVDAADYSDYYSEWDDGKKSLSRTYSGSRTMKDSTLMKSKDDIASNKKQHKVRRKLLMGGLIRRKNRSMPDLTDTNDEAFHDFDDAKIKKKKDTKVEDTFHSEINSAIQTRGFLQPHPAFTRSSNKLHQPNRLPPPPPVRIPTTKLSEEPQTMVVQVDKKKLLKKNSLNPTKLSSFSSENHLFNSPHDLNRKSPSTVKTKDYPEYMNLQTIQINLRKESPSPIQVQEPNHKSYSSSSLERYDNKCNGTRSSTPQYMNTMDYMNMCNATVNHVSSSPHPHNQPEYMNLQYFREVQNENDSKSGPSSLPLPPPPAPQETSSTLDDLPLPPPPEQLLSELHDEPDGTSTEEKQSSFLLELKAKKEELERKASEKSNEVANKEETGQKKSGWLQELQAKQVKMLQKKQCELKPTGALNSNISDKEIDLVKKDEKLSVQNKVVKTKTTEPFNQKIENVVPSSISANKDPSARSVKDLASRFEKILTTPQDSSEPVGASPVQQISETKCPTNTIQNLDDRIKNLKSPAMKRKADRTNNESPKPVITTTETKQYEPLNHVPSLHENSSDFTPFMLSFSEMTEEELDEIAKCTDKNTQSNALITNASNFMIKNNANDNFNRPMQPPDYETAIKRIGQREINNNSLEKADILKKANRLGRKSVKFSDQVVLVACNDIEEEYMPHPLLEKAFRQHCAEKSEHSSTVENAQEIQANYCDLCHNNPVMSQSEQYCSDCSFYMSRFRPKN